MVRLPKTWIHIKPGAQTLSLIDDGVIIFNDNVSTSRRGLGQTIDSYQTPHGWHIVRAKIGSDLPINAVFKARRPTGEIYSPKLAEGAPGRDWILSRILWLSGLEVGKNRLSNVDTMRRFIYIHGTPDEAFVAKPESMGCVRMLNQSLVQLFQMVDVRTPVFIGDEVYDCR